MKLLRIGVDAVEPIVRSLDLTDEGHDQFAVAVPKRFGSVAAIPPAELLT